MLQYHYGDSVWEGGILSYLQDILGGILSSSTKKSGGGILSGGDFVLHSITTPQKRVYLNNYVFQLKYNNEALSVVALVEQISWAIFQGGGLWSTTFVCIYQNVRIGL